MVHVGKGIAGKKVSGTKDNGQERVKEKAVTYRFVFSPVYHGGGIMFGQSAPYN